MKNTFLFLPQMPDISCIKSLLLFYDEASINSVVVPLSSWLSYFWILLYVFCAFVNILGFFDEHLVNDFDYDYGLLQTTDNLKVIYKFFDYWLSSRSYLEFLREFLYRAFINLKSLFLNLKKLSNANSISIAAGNIRNDFPK